MKKAMILTMILSLLFSIHAFAADYSKVPLKEAEGTTAEEMFETEMYNYKVIQNIPTAYDSASWNAYCSAASSLDYIDPDNIDEMAKGIIQAAADARAQLVQVKDVEDAMWFIWGDDMPVAEPESLDFSSAVDNEDFRPYLVPYLLEDQSQVKGNLILVSGGGYFSRANNQEGYPTAAVFNDRGYNCFVLQRRVFPYGKDEIWSDLQRSVRFLRYYAEQKGLGAADIIAAAGFSGGSATVLGAMANYYGDILPTTYDPDYQPDDVDAVNSDLDVAICIYGPNYNDQDVFEGIVTDNPALPPVLLIAGAQDQYKTAPDNMTLYTSLADKTTVELYTFAYAPHGFGAGMAGTNTTLWPLLADSYIQLTHIIEHDNSVEIGEQAEYGIIPDRYTKYQTYSVMMPFGEVEVTQATTDDENYFILYFTAFGDNQIITGINMDGEAVLRYDRTGFFGSDIQNLFGGKDDDAWVPVE